jgi:hypothetical protein
MDYSIKIPVGKGQVVVQSEIATIIEIVAKINELANQSESNEYLYFPLRFFIYTEGDEKKDEKFDMDTDTIEDRKSFIVNIKIKKPTDKKKAAELLRMLVVLRNLDIDTALAYSDRYIWDYEYVLKYFDEFNKSNYTDVYNKAVEILKDVLEENNIKEDINNTLVWFLPDDAQGELYIKRKNILNEVLNIEKAIDVIYEQQKYINRVINAETIKERAENIVTENSDLEILKNIKKSIEDKENKLTTLKLTAQKEKLEVIVEKVIKRSKEKKEKATDVLKNNIKITNNKIAIGEEAIKMTQKEIEVAISNLKNIEKTEKNNDEIKKIITDIVSKKMKIDDMKNSIKTIPRAENASINFTNALEEYKKLIKESEKVDLLNTHECSYQLSGCIRKLEFSIEESQKKLKIAEKEILNKESDLPIANLIIEKLTAYILSPTGDKALKEELKQLGNSIDKIKKERDNRMKIITKHITSAISLLKSSPRVLSLEDICNMIIEAFKVLSNIKTEDKNNFNQIFSYKEE